MARKLTNSEVRLCPSGLLVINPQSRLGEADMALLMSSLASMIRGQRAHIAHPHCVVAKDHDEGSDLFIIEACTACKEVVCKRDNGSGPDEKPGPCAFLGTAIINWSYSKRPSRCREERQASSKVR